MSRLPLANPFVRDVVGSALDDAKSDVPRINVEAKKECVALIDRVRLRGESGSLCLFGEPGSGKTHLLSRLRYHLDRENESGKPSLFVAIRMQTSPSMIWRFLRANLAEALLRRVGNESALVRLLSPKRHALELMPNRDLGIVLEQLLDGVRIRDASSWLRGHDLPETSLQALGLGLQPVDEEFQEERAYQFVRDLASVLEPVPIVICLDQVESLQRYVDDQEGIFALGKLVAALHDTLHNAAIVCCVQTSFIDAIQKSIRGSEQDRMLANRAGLRPLDWEQAAELLAARLDAQPEIVAARPAQADRLWPLNPEKLKPLFAGGVRCAPRRILHQAKLLFDETEGTQAQAPEMIEDYLRRLYEQRLTASPAEESDFIIRDALPQVLQIMGLQPRGENGVRPGGFDLIVEHENRPVAFALCNQRPGTALVNRFRKLGERWDTANGPRLVLLRDARLGIGASARASQQRLDELMHRNADLVQLSPETLSALRALRSLLADAESGDLSYRGETVGRQKVEEWLANHLPAPVADLVNRLKGSPVRDVVVVALSALLEHKKIVSIEDAARELGVGLQEVANCANQNPEQFVLIGGNRQVLFQPVRAVVAS